MSATIATLKKSDEATYNRLFAEYHKKVFYYVLSKTNSPYIAEEVTQLTFIKLWQYRYTLNEEFAISQQIFRIARTTLIDLIRIQNNQKRLLTAASDAHKFSEDSSYNTLAEKQLREQVIRVLQQMPPVRKKIFELSRFGGLTYREISESLSISIKAIEKQISHAIKQLKHALLLLLAIIFLLF